MKNSNINADVGLALVEALNPMLDVCLEAGITSPEFEALVRVAYVLRAMEKLPRHAKSGRPPTANKVSLATGLTWEEVSKILASGQKKAAQTRMGDVDRSSSKSTRVIEGWTTDPKYLTSGGQPLDLPVKRAGKRLSFRDLVAEYVPSTHPGTLMKEMIRRGQVELLEGEIVRFTRAKSRAVGVSPNALREASKKVSRVMATLYQTLKPGAFERVAEESPAFKVPLKFANINRRRIERQVRNLMATLSAEYEGKASDADPDKQTIGFSFYEWSE